MVAHAFNPSTWEVECRAAHGARGTGNNGGRQRESGTPWATGNWPWRVVKGRVLAPQSYLALLRLGRTPELCGPRAGKPSSVLNFFSLRKPITSSLGKLWFNS